MKEDEFEKLMCKPLTNAVFIAGIAQLCAVLEVNSPENREFDLDVTSMAEENIAKIIKQVVECVVRE